MPKLEYDGSRSSFRSVTFRPINADGTSAFASEIASSPDELQDVNSRLFSRILGANTGVAIPTAASAAGTAFTALSWQFHRAGWSAASGVLTTVPSYGERYVFAYEIDIVNNAGVFSTSFVPRVALPSHVLLAVSDSVDIRMSVGGTGGTELTFASNANAVRPADTSIYVYEISLALV